MGSNRKVYIKWISTNWLYRVQNTDPIEKLWADINSEYYKDVTNEDLKTVKHLIDESVKDFYLFKDIFVSA